MRVQTRVMVLAALLTFPASAFALTPEVHDAAGFFKPETVTKANEIIKAIKRDKKKDLLIETFQHVPAGKEKEATSSDHQERDRFFSKWAKERAEEAKVNGIYVLICKEPPYIKVAVGDQTHKEFGDDKRNHLGKILVDRFKKKEYDEGLLEAVRYVESTLPDATEHPNDQQHHAGGGGHHGDGFPGSPGDNPSISETLYGLLCPLLLGLLCVGLVIVGVIALMRMFRGGGGSGPGGYGGGYGPGGYPPGYGGGFGGMLSTFAASLLGGAAGMWMYDTFFGGSRGAAPMTPPTTSSTGGQGPSDAPAPEDTDYTAGGGGDFGDSGGGGDAGGGGDFGSGDYYGGGDTGGGGDFGGGGDMGGSGGDAGGGGDF